MLWSVYLYFHRENTVFRKCMKWCVINLWTLTERHEITFRKQLINLLYLNSENPVIHSYLYNISIYHIAVDKIAKIKFYPVSFA
jgi:hypothetical protein